jgi:hypothetical protein
MRGYRLLQPHSNEIIIRRDVKFDENLLVHEPNSSFVPFLTCDPSSTFVPYFVPFLVCSSDDDNESENTPPSTHQPLDESIEHELATVPPLPI